MYKIVDVEKLNENPVPLVTNDIILTTDKNNINQSVCSLESRTDDYLSEAITTLSNALNKITSQFDSVDASIFTTEDTPQTRYIPNGELIHKELLENIIAKGKTGGLLTKDELTEYKESCISLISELRTKIVNTFTLALDNVYKIQQSRSSELIGGTGKNEYSPPEYGAIADTNETKIEADQGSGLVTPSDYRFTDGVFTLIHMLTDYGSRGGLYGVDDFTELYSPEEISSMTKDEVDEKIPVTSDNSDIPIFFNKGLSSSLGDDETGKVVPPTSSVDESGNNLNYMYPMFQVLKRQIYVVMKNLYMFYIIRFTGLDTTKDNKSG